MVDVGLDSASEIDKIAQEILRGSKARGIFPTPVDKITRYAELTLDKNLCLGNKKQSFFSKTWEGIGKISKKVLGLLDYRQKTIFLDLTQNLNRQRFIQLHEVGHGVCPWQKDAFCWSSVCLGPWVSTNTLIRRGTSSSRPCIFKQRACSST